MKRAEHGTKLDTDAKHDAPKPAAQTGKHPRDAREEPGKLPENRRELGVDEKHETEDMERGHRGTFP